MFLISNESCSTLKLLFRPCKIVTIPPFPRKPEAQETMPTLRKQVSK